MTQHVNQSANRWILLPVDRARLAPFACFKSLWHAKLTGCYIFTESGINKKDCYEYCAYTLVSQGQPHVVLLFQHDGVVLSHSW